MLLAQLEGIIPALESAHALAHVVEIAPQMPKDQLIVLCLSGRGDKDLFSVAEHAGRHVNEPDRATLRRLARAGAGGARHLHHRGRSRSGDLARHCSRRCPRPGADMIELGMPFTDPMADGPAIQAAGLRALKAGMTLHGRAGSGGGIPQGRRRHADRADGLLQSHLCLWRRQVSGRRQGGRARTA